MTDPRYLEWARRLAAEVTAGALDAEEVIAAALEEVAREARREAYTHAAKLAFLRCPLSHVIEDYADDVCACDVCTPLLLLRAELRALAAKETP